MSGTATMAGILFILNYMATLSLDQTTANSVQMLGAQILNTMSLQKTVTQLQALLANPPSGTSSQMILAIQNTVQQMSSAMSQNGTTPQTQYVNPVSTKFCDITIPSILSINAQNAPSVVTNIRKLLNNVLGGVGNPVSMLINLNLIRILNGNAANNLGVVSGQLSSYVQQCMPLSNVLATLTPQSIPPQLAYLAPVANNTVNLLKQWYP